MESQSIDELQPIAEAAPPAKAFCDVLVCLNANRCHHVMNDRNGKRRTDKHTRDVQSINALWPKLLRTLWVGTG